MALTHIDVAAAQSDQGEEQDVAVQAPLWGRGGEKRLQTPVHII